MRITESQLRRIIRQEVRALREVLEDPDYEMFKLNLQNATGEIRSSAPGEIRTAEEWLNKNHSGWRTNYKLGAGGSPGIAPLKGDELYRFVYDQTRP